MSEDKKAQIKEAIRQLHDGVPPEQVKEKFRAVFEGTDSLEIARIEEELAKEGCETGGYAASYATFTWLFSREQIERQNLNLKPSQPIRILMEEHKIMTKMAEDLVSDGQQNSQESPTCKLRGRGYSSG